MRVLSSLLLLVSTVLAYQVTSPNNQSGWTTAGPNTVQWVRVDTDPTTFALFLTNVNNGNPSVLLNSNVDGTLGSIVANAPSGGWPTGSGFRVNFAQDSSHPDSLLAQSQEFTITGTTSSSTQSGSSTASTQTGTGTATTVNTATSSLSSSATSTTPTGTNGAALRADTPAGVLTAVAAVAALFTTLF